MIVHRGPRALSWVLDALGEPTRRRAYDAVRAANRPVTRAEVAAALGIGGRLAAFHLDKLVAEGLLAAHYARPSDRPGGPGAGRPAKWYTAGEHQFDITLPPRRNDIAARILTRTVGGLGLEGAHLDRLLEHAREHGRQLGAASPSAGLLPLLVDLGYQPQASPEGSVDLLNCPFHHIVEESREIVCAMNLALLKGVLDAMPSGRTAVLQPAKDRCCVRLMEDPARRTRRPTAPH